MSFYPLEAIAPILEKIESETIENEFICAISNKNGLLGCEWFSAEKKYDSLRETYSSIINKFEDEYPRFAKILRKIAENFGHDVEYHKYDKEAFDMR